MSDYALTPLAKADIFDIWSYIADDNAFVAEGPMRGHSRPDLTTRSLRFWTLTRYPNYTVVYLPGPTPLQIVAVLHGKRNMRRVLKQRP